MLLPKFVWTMMRDESNLIVNRTCTLCALARYPVQVTGWTLHTDLQPTQ